MMNQVDLLNAFRSGTGVQSMNSLLSSLNNSNSAAAAVLALAGFEENVKSGVFVASEDTLETIRELLRKWRCESLLDQAYGGAFRRATTALLRSLTIFKSLDVPLFIDDYGQKRSMSDYPQLEIISIDLDTPIVHVTHTKQKEEILEEQMFTPSDNKNAIKGIWFSPKYQLGERPSSVYGNWAFETTLRKLGVSGLRQGEIVSYKREVNFILYASDTVSQVLQKATDKAVKTPENGLEYTCVSIFVPSRFLPKQAKEFQSKIINIKPYSVSHSSFCVKERRSQGRWKCEDLKCTATPGSNVGSDTGSSTGADPGIDLGFKKMTIKDGDHSER